MLGTADRAQTMVGAEAHEVGDREQNLYLNMHDFCFTLHPCYESLTLDHDQNPSSKSKDGGQAGLFRQACNELGLSPDLMDQMYLPIYTTLADCPKEGDKQTKLS